MSSFTVLLKRINALGSFVIYEVDDDRIINHLQERFHQDVTQILLYSLEGEG